MPKQIEMEQQTAEWLQFRLGGLGGSDANLIAAFFMGLDFPYGDTWPGAALYKLWSEKTGRTPLKPKKDRSWGDYVDPLVHGTKMEVVAREWWAMETGEFGAPAVLEHDVLSHMRASLDLYVPGTIAAEVKCPKEPGDHRRAKEGEIPRKYLGQMHHNFHVAGVPEFHFVSYYEGEGVIVPFVPDPEFMGDLLTAEAEFWTWVVTEKFPLATGNFELSGSNEFYPEWAEALGEYWRQEAQVREAEAGLRYHKLHLMRLMQKIGGGKVTGGGGKVSLSVRKATTVKAREYTKSEFLNLLVQHAGEEEGDGE